MYPSTIILTIMLSNEKDRDKKKLLLKFIEGKIKNS